MRFSLQLYKTTNPSAILSNQATYYVQAASVADSGVYGCRASNRQSSVTRDVTVTVSPLPTTIAAQTTTEPPLSTTTMTTMATTKEVHVHICKTLARYHTNNYFLRSNGANYDAILFDTAADYW